MAALKAIGAYIAGIVGFFLFWLWFFDNPSKHEILITVLTGFCSSAVAAGIIEDAHFDDKGEEFITYLITAVVTSGFWVYAFYGDYSDIVEIEKNPIFSAVGSVMYSWTNLLMAAITFFVIMSRKFF